MSRKNIHAWLAWTLPLIISGSMAFGSLVGFSLSGYMVQNPELPGDLVGSGAGVVIILMTGFIGLCLSLITLTAAKIKRHKKWDYIILRIVFSITGGASVGALGTKDGAISILSAWIILFVTPIICSWPWSTNRSSRP